MLVVTRKIGESILIGDNIEVSISKIEDGSVKIAIEAPKDIRILRKEIYKQVEQENIEAAVIDLKVLKDIKK
ncbi:carbon storage regulator CsrA [Inconstantimicrobium mannanitabidum]|uniref:Carbon storage regulator n=1 Tax=Inconstantimicrobium mannanitabidum TaxID=1604901 RepID=A0ACB5R8U5_9CLOT|nr:carbon storage regulator CsrA [Clostridium sp. TW13]GKX65462.1 carbon storage regulator [Clostridium sp. TW13]